MGNLLNTLNKSLPGLSSMPLEGQFLCCALSVLAIVLYKNVPQNVLVSSSFSSPRKRLHGPCKPRVRHFPCRALQSFNSPGDWARELFKSSTDSTSLALQFKKNFFRFEFEIFWGGTSQVGVFLCYFGHLFLALGAVPMGYLLDSKICWKLGQNPRL